MNLETNDTFQRSFVIERVADTEEVDTRTVELAFSSEEPYMRYFGEEILDHQPDSVKLERLNNAGAVLVGHDHDDQVGVVESARIDADGKGRAVIRFSRSARGEEIYNDVKDGIRKLVSVGYRIHKYEVTERDGLPDLVRVTDWEPYEISIVSVPADPTVGVGRSDKPNNDEKVIKMTEPVKDTAPAIDTKKVTADVRKAEMDRINAIRSTAEHHELEDLGRQAIEEGWSASKFNEQALSKVGERNNKARAESEHDGEVDLSPKEQRTYSMSRLMEALANPTDRAAQQRAAFELEVSDAAVQGFGGDFKARGAYIPSQVLQRANNVTVPAEGGNLVATDLLAGSFIDVLRNTSAVMGAGATFLQGLVGNVDLPRQTSGSTMAWINGEDGDATESEPTFDLVSLRPRDAAVYTEVTRRTLQQATPSIDAIIRRDIAVAIALGIDKAALYGTATNGQPRGITLQTGINTKTFAALGAPTYAEIIDMIKLMMADNAYAGMPRFLMEAGMWAHLSTAPKQASGAEGNFILGDNDRIKGLPYTQSQQVNANNLFLGDFSQLLIGEWGGMELNVDPYTHSLKGRVRYVAFKTIDTAVRHPESFVFGSGGA